jgi:hypothetical protein
MNYSDHSFDDELELTKEGRRSLERHRKKGACSSDRAEHVLYAELLVRGCVTAGNLDYLAAELLHRYGGAEQAIEALRSEKMKFELVPLTGGADEARLQITLPDPDENDLLLVFFVDPEDEDSLVDFLDSLGEIYGDDKGEDIMAKILGPEVLARAILEALVREGVVERAGDWVRLAKGRG